MMRPPRGVWSFMIRNACWVHRNGAVRLVFTTACHCARLKSSNGIAGAPMPALLKRTSSRPKASITLANSAAIDPGSVMSAETGRLLPKLSPSFLVSSSLSRRRPASTTVNPAFISASDAARPTPVPAPVTTAILFPASVICFLPLCTWLAFGLVGWSWNILMRGAQGRRPARTQIVKIRLARLDAVIEIGVTDVRSHHQHVDRQTDAEIGAHRRIHRYQAGLQRLIQFDVVVHGAVEHRLAIFMLADLQIRRVGGAFDEIAGRVDHEQPHPRALDLAAEQERNVEIDVLDRRRTASGGG